MALRLKMRFRLLHHSGDTALSMAYILEAQSEPDWWYTTSEKVQRSAISTDTTVSSQNVPNVQPP